MKAVILRQRRLMILLEVLVLLASGAMALHPWSGEPGWYTRGVAAFDRGDVKTATMELERGVKAGTGNARAYDLLSDCYMASGRVDAALAMLQRLRAIDSQYPHLATREAEAYLPADNDYTLRYAREAVLQEPRSPRARILLAYALARSGAGSAALVQGRIAQHLSDQVGQALQDVSGADIDPQKVAMVLRSLIFRVPYE